MVSDNKPNKPIRVLQIVGRMDRGGIENMVMNLYRNIDRDKVQFDFLAHYGREAAFNDEIRAMGGRIFEMPCLRDETHIYYWKIFEYIRALVAFFKQHSEFKIIHGHMTNTASIYMPIAKKYGVTCRIAHSHTTHGKKGLLGIVTQILQKPISLFVTDWFACSKVAAKWLYSFGTIESGKMKIVPNAVDAQKFRFDPSKRKAVRNELELGDSLVIGCVARFRPEKNQIFLVDILHEMLQRKINCKLMFVGDGPMEQQVKDRVIQMGLQEYTLFLGQRSDVPDLMQAMDVFVLASLFEGLPVVGIEAQASGLPCVISDTVTKEMDIFEQIYYLSLEQSVNIWVETIQKAAEMERKDTYEQINQAGYDIHITAPWLQEFYLEKHHQ